MLPIQDIFPLLQSPKNIFLTTHHKPDGDALGSMLGLHHYLVKKGHNVTSVSPGEIPSFLEWMPGINIMYNFEETPTESFEALKNADIIIGLDFNNFGRTKHLESHLAEAKQIKVLIDHHLEPSTLWDYGWSIPSKSSTCEMVYDFINALNDRESIDQNIAACLYTGVMTDTGIFRFPVATSSVHLMVSELLKTGLDHSKIYDEVYDSWTENRMRFLGYVLIEKMEVYKKYNSALITLSRKDMNLFNIQSGDTEGLVNYPLSIANIQFATLITERSDEIKLSFRSKGNFDVSTFASKYFKGGGHFNASGGISKINFLETIDNFKAILHNNHPK